MKDKVTFFLPVRKGSERVINKNTKDFCGVRGGLLGLKLRQLMESEQLDEIVLSTNDEVSMDIAREIDPDRLKIKTIQRPEELCASDTPLQNLIKYVPQIIDSGHILWGHTTTPFIDAADYDQIIETYLNKLEQGYDSLITTFALQNFLLDPTDGHIINYNHKEGNWPRTQDLPVVQEVNHAVFMTSRSTYMQYSDRIGRSPFLYEQNKIKSFDIDWEEDFLIAEAIYEKLFKR